MTNMGLWLLIFAAGCLLAVVLAVYPRASSYMSPLPGELTRRQTIVGALLAVALLVAGPAGFLIVGDGVTSQTSTSTARMVALPNGTQVEGPSLIFLARLSRTDQFEVVLERDGALSLERIDARGVLIREDASAATARVEITRCQRADDAPALIRGKWCSEEATTIHVPPGTVTSDITSNRALTR